MNSYMGFALTIALVASTIAALDNAVVDEFAIENKADALAEMLTQRGGRALMEKEVSKLAPEAMSPTISLFQEEEVPEDEGTNNFAEVDASATIIEQKAALAGAHVKEDQAALLLSGDAQTLEKLKGQMSLEVVKAKAQLAAKSESGAATAKKAAALAKQVVKATTKVKSDEAKESKAKDLVKKMKAQLDATNAAPPKISADGSVHLPKSHHISGASYLSKTASDIDASADGDGPKDLPDPISKALLAERHKYHELMTEEGTHVEKAKTAVAHLETSVQTYSDNLTKAKRELAQTNLALRSHLKKHAINQQLFDKITAKESHHKKMTKLKEQIQRQEDMLKVQTMKIKASKEQLHKSFEEKRHLGKVPSGNTARVSRTHAQPQPAVSRAVQAVSKNLHSQDLEAEMAPQIAMLKKKLRGKPKQLEEAIDQLVSRTVANKVDNAFSEDPNVMSAVHSAVGSVRSQAASKSAALAQAAAQRGISDAVSAGHALDVADSKFDSNSKFSPAEEDLEEVLREID